MNTEFPISLAETSLKVGENYQGITMRVLGNFHSNFPIGDYPNKPGGEEAKEYRAIGRRRELTASFEAFDIPHAIRDPKLTKSLGNSKLFVYQTAAEFFAILDKAVEKHVPMVQFVETINRTFFTERRTDRAREYHHQQYWEMALPIYLELRNMGYSRSDLMQ